MSTHFYIQYITTVNGFMYVFLEIFKYIINIKSYKFLTKVELES